MNIQSQDLKEKLGKFPNLFTLNPVVTSSGTFKPADWARGVFLEPVTVQAIAKELAAHIKTDYEVVAGIDLSGVALALALAKEAGRPAVIVREKAKRLGRSAIVGDVNFIRSGVRVLLVDDLLAGGNTKRNRIVSLKAAGAEVVGIAVFLEAILNASRHLENYRNLLDGRQQLIDSGLPLYSLLTHHELVDLQLQYGTIDKEFAELLYAVDELDAWDDDELGYLSKTKKYCEKRGVPFPDYIKEHFASKGIAL